MTKAWIVEVKSSLSEFAIQENKIYIAFDVTSEDLSQFNDNEKNLRSLLNGTKKDKDKCIKGIKNLLSIQNDDKVIIKHEGELYIGVINVTYSIVQHNDQLEHCISVNNLYKVDKELSGSILINREDICLPINDVNVEAIYVNAHAHGTLVEVKSESQKLQELNDVFTQIDANFETNLQKWKDEYKGGSDEIIADLEKKQDAAGELLGILSSSTLSGAYGREMEKDRRPYIWFFFFGICFVTFAVFLVAFPVVKSWFNIPQNPLLDFIETLADKVSILDNENNSAVAATLKESMDIQWERTKIYAMESLLRIPIAILMLIPGGYLLKEAEKNRKEYRRNQRIYTMVTSFNNFVETLPDDDKKKMRDKFANIIFSQNIIFDKLDEKGVKYSLAGDEIDSDADVDNSK